MKNCPLCGSELRIVRTKDLIEYECDYCAFEDKVKLHSQ